MRESAELCDLIAGYFRSFTEGDVDWVDRHVSRDRRLRLIGTDPKEWQKGEAGFDAFRREAATPGALIVELSEIEAYRAGEVGWGAARVMFTNQDGATAEARFTVVLELDEDAWKVVNSHTSIAVPDSEAFDGS